MHLATAIEEFLDGYFYTCGRSPKTQTAYRIDLLQLKRFIGSGALLETVAPDRLEAWARNLRDLGFKGTSIRRKFAAVRVFFTYWVRRGVIAASPLSMVRLDLGRERQLPRNLSKTDTERLIEQVWYEFHSNRDVQIGLRPVSLLRIRNVAIIEILFATGMRVGELVNLKVNDWREDEASFLVNGKGACQRVAFLPDARTVGAVKEYLEIRQRFAKETDYLLISARGGRLLTQGVARTISETAIHASIAPRVTPHMIRHTVATLLMTYGVDIRMVQEVLGHASIITTQRYVHVSKEFLRSTLQVRHPIHHLDLDINRAGAADCISACASTHKRV